MRIKDNEWTCSEVTSYVKALRWSTHLVVGYLKRNVTMKHIFGIMTVSIEECGHIQINNINK